MELLARTNVGRDINRHYYTREEIDREIERPVVRRLFELIRLRNSHPAFGGRFVMAESAESALDLRWSNGDDFARLFVDLASLEHRIAYSSDGTAAELRLIDSPRRSRAAGV